MSMVSALALAGAGSNVSASVESTLDDAFAPLKEVPGKFSINTRLRYEIFDLDNGNPALDRDGTSLRVRYGYTTPDFEGFTAMIEGETLTRVGGDAGDIHPLDDAGDGTDLNQAFIAYKNADFGSAKVGRQIYALDDQRFIGHVGWRQNIQTFDAATAAFTGVDNLTVNAFYFNAVERVNLDSNPLDSFGINVNYKLAPEAVVTVFYYDIENDDLIGFNNETLGIRFTGTAKIDDFAFKYLLSYATQDGVDTGEEGDYFAGDISGSFSGFTLGAGFEILEAGFRTPLATVHKFNGFADALLPVTGFTNGLEDIYVYAGYKIPVGEKKFIPVKVIYHWFDSEESVAGQNGGSELDFVASYAVNKYLSLVAKYGDYSEDGGVGNAGAFDKTMFTFEVNFKY
ncbi:MAG: alginate export family protein [Verrucomicrobiota bacterium]